MRQRRGLIRSRLGAAGLVARLAGLSLLTAVASGSFGCAEERDPINRVQANALGKSFFVGPSVGHFYAGEVWRGVLMTGLRTGGLALFGAGAMRTQNYKDGDCIGPCSAEYEYEDERRKGERLMLLGGAIVVGSALYDIYVSRYAARRTNAMRDAQWQVAPTVISSRGQTLPAVSLSGAF